MSLWPSGISSSSFLFATSSGSVTWSETVSEGSGNKVGDSSEGRVGGALLMLSVLSVIMCLDVSLGLITTVLLPGRLFEDVAFGGFRRRCRFARLYSR